MLTAQKAVESVRPDFEILLVGSTIPDQRALNVILWRQWTETQTYLTIVELLTSRANRLFCH